MADAAKWFHSGTRSIAIAAEKNARPGEIGPGAVGDREDHHRVAEAAPIHTKLSWVAVAVAIWFLSLTASNAQKINTTQKSSRSMTSQVKFQPASVQAQPDLKCILYPSGGLPSSGLAVYTDEDGYARFHAIPASGKAEGKQLTLNCTNTAGKPFRYTVDLS